MCSSNVLLRQLLICPSPYQPADKMTAETVFLEIGYYIPDPWQSIWYAVGTQYIFVK